MSTNAKIGFAVLFVFLTASLCWVVLREAGVVGPLTSLSQPPEPPVQARAVIVCESPEQLFRLSMAFEGPEFIKAVLDSQPGRTLSKRLREGLSERRWEHLSIGPWRQGASGLLAIEVRGCARGETAEELAGLAARRLIDLHLRPRRREALAEVNQATADLKRLRAELARWSDEDNVKARAAVRAGRTKLLQEIQDLQNRLSGFELDYHEAKAELMLLVEIQAAGKLSSHPDVLSTVSKDAQLLQLWGQLAAAEAELAGRIKSGGMLSDEVAALKATTASFREQIARRRRDVLEATPGQWIAKARAKLEAAAKMRQQPLEQLHEKSKELVKVSSGWHPIPGFLESTGEELRTRIAAAEGVIEKLGPLADGQAPFPKFLGVVRDGTWTPPRDDAVRTASPATGQAR